MRLDVGGVSVRFEAPGTRRPLAERAAAEFRSALERELSSALTAHGADADGVVIVPRLKVTVRAPLGRVGGAELARRIADASLHAIVHESCALGDSPNERNEGTAERTLRALTLLDGLRVDPATEAAAWLVALARDERSVVRSVSPYSDLEHLPSAAAFVAVCERAGARAVTAALGAKWAYTLALRCTPAEASRLLMLFVDGAEAPAHTWVMLRAFRDLLRRAVRARAAADAVDEPNAHHTRATAGSVECELAAMLGAEIWAAIAREFARAAFERSGLFASEGGDMPRANAQHALLLTVRGVLEGYPGAASAAKTLAAPSASTALSATAPEMFPAETAASATDDSSSSGERRELPLESNCTGIWILLPYLARRLHSFEAQSRGGNFDDATRQVGHDDSAQGGFDSESARAVAFVVAERLWGPAASRDPAVAAFVCGREPEALRAAMPRELRVARLCVSLLRDFAQGLRRFERARPGYLLKATLTGPGLVCRTPAGWSATLPQAPLRIVIERAGLLGGVTTPWDEPALTFVRDP